ncbi:MAG TPA: DUF2894 domain-containing protein, partial [Lysobacter sp.]
MHSMPSLLHARDCPADAVRQAHAEALARRAAGQSETVRRLLDARLAVRVGAPTTGTPDRPDACSGESGAATTGPEPAAAAG